MNPKVRIRAEAEDDIKEAYDWYEARLPGLGDGFLEAIEICYQRMTENPMSYAVVHKSIRRALLTRFPYGIFYLIENDELVVIACFHCSRDPRTWRRRA